METLKNYIVSILFCWAKYPGLKLLRIFLNKASYILMSSFPSDYTVNDLI